MFGQLIDDIKQQIARVRDDLGQRLDQNVKVGNELNDKLKTLVSQENLKAQLDEKLAAFVSMENLKAQFEDKMSIHKVYRMRSELGDWCASVYTGQRVSGSGMA